MPFDEGSVECFVSCKIKVNHRGVLFQIVPRVVQRGRQEPDVAWLLDRVVEVQSVRVRVRLQQNKPQPVPAIDFADSTGQSIADNKEVNIYVTSTDYFTTKFRQVFTKTQIKFTTAKYARKWLAKPDMSFWPQQLNFALWCATTGCGVSREMLFPSTLNLSEQIRTFYQFHVYYTTRTILYEMGGIQNKNALPDDPAFNQQENPYDVASPMGKTTGWGM